MEKLAEDAGVPLTKFVIEVFESALDEGSDFKPRGQLVQEIGKLRSENKLLRDGLNQKKVVLEKYETELKRYRSQAFVEDKFDGVRKYNRELIAVPKQVSSWIATSFLKSWRHSAWSLQPSEAGGGQDDREQGKRGHKSINAP